MAKPGSFDEYITGFPKEAQQALKEIRSIVRKEIPEAEEVISYDMPTFKFKNSYLVHYAAFKKHIGLYPAPTGNPEFAEALAGYKTGKGSVQLPLDKPMPVELIVRILKFNEKRIVNRENSK
ncbi:DUF1801 domain-containing protein [Dyadobacter sp. 32]|uniref:iron chaperone n=1 Tax=Dyadobacter sp. 32 TaxID=538966 RepID=UPI0011EE5C62